MPTIPLQPGNADCWPGGQYTFKVQFDTFLNSAQPSATSGVQIAITAADGSMAGTGTPLAATSTGVVSVGGDQAVYEYGWHVPANTVPGDYEVTWTGTRTSDSAAVSLAQVVTVAAVPDAAPATGVYASVAQYQARTGDSFTPAPMVAARLQLATEQIDRAVIGAVYATDADGMPLDAGLADVLMRATIEQCRYLNADNDDSHLKREFSAMNVGGVSWTRTPSMQGLSMPPLAPQAAVILQNAGVLSVAPLIGW
jgi:hypothetical protein